MSHSLHRGFALSLAFAFAAFLWCSGSLAGADDPPASEQPAKPPLNLKIGDLFGQQGPGGIGNTENALSLSAEFRLAENGRDGLLSVKAVVADGWHVYSVTQEPGGPIASKIKVTPTKEIESVGMFAPDAKPHVREIKEFPVPVEEHEGEVTWSAPLRLAEGIDGKALVIAIRYDGQVCTDGVDGVGGLCDIKSNVPLSAKYAGVLAAVPATPTEPARTAPEKAYRPTGSKVALEGTLDKAVVAPGGKVKLSITATPDENWYVYGLEKRDPNLVSKPTLIVFTETGGLQMGEPVASTPPKVKKTGIEKAPEAKYHPEPITWTTEFSVPSDAKSGEMEIVGFIGYQTCENDACQPPQAAEFRAKLTIGNARSAAASTLAFTAAKYKAVAELAAQSGPSAGLALSNIKVKSDTANLPLYYVLPIALLGGFILNFMPCVLPVIGLKVLSFVQQAGQSRAKVFALNVWYSLGMLAVFMVLATLAVVWNFGWGEQNNSNIFNIAMVAIVFTMGLSFLGVWEIPIPGFVGGSAAGNLAQKEGPLGAFFKGAITTLLATPCSGPGLATALAWCNGKPAHLVYLVFACLGLGMALPYLVIGASPNLVKLLPKPGAWMETFKQLMGFVLLGTVVFIFTYMPVALIVPTVALLFGLWAACWWIGRTPLTAEPAQTATAWIAGAVVASAVGSFAFLWLSPYMKERFDSAVDRELTERQSAVPAPGSLAEKNEHELPWQPYSLEKLSSLTAERKTVMVDFTADWCLTCKTLEAAVLNTKDVREAVDKHQIETLVADWTNKDPQIGELLEALGSKQIPVLAIFPAGRPNEPIVLIGGYTQGTLIKRLEEAAAIGAKSGETTTAMK